MDAMEEEKFEKQLSRKSYVFNEKVRKLWPILTRLLQLSAWVKFRLFRKYQTHQQWYKDRHTDGRADRGVQEQVGIHDSLEIYNNNNSCKNSIAHFYGNCFHTDWPEFLIPWK